MPSTSRTRASALLATALAGAAAASATPAHASAPSYAPTGTECTLSVAAMLSPSTGHALVDALGYRFDTTSNLVLTQGLPAQYATLAEGSSTTAVSGKTIGGAYYNWGDLFVGSTESRATQYRDGGALGCDTDSSGRQVAFATKTMSGLEVQRKLFVSNAGTSGARLIETLHNPGPDDVTTDVYVGDMTSGLGAGSLGSAGHTTIGATSSGDPTIDADDHWAVTSDGGTSTGAPAVAHVWDGPGGAERASIQLSGAQAGNEALDLATPTQLAPGKFGYGWQGITVPAGGTASYLSWELMRATGTTGAAARDAAQILAAKNAAADLSSAPLSAVYEGMTAADIAAVRNWAKPVVSATIAPVSDASAATPTPLGISALDYGSSTIAACSSGWLSWDFGDGATAIGSAPIHQFRAGPQTATVTAHSDCGGQSTSHVNFTVATPTISSTAGSAGTAIDSPLGTDALPIDSAAASPPAPTPSGVPAATQVASVPAASAGPAAGLAVNPPPLILTAMPKINATQIAKKGVDATVQSSVGGSLRLVLTGTGIKLVKVTSIAAGGPRTTNLKFGPSASKALTTVKTLQLRATLTLPGGAQIVSTRPITVHH